MKLDALPSPGLLASGMRLQTESIKAISYVEVVAPMKAGGKTEQAATLTAFWNACIAAVATFVDAVVPTYVSGIFSVAAAPKTVTLTYSEGLNQTILPAATSWVLSQGGAVVSAAIVGAKVVLTTTNALTNIATTVTYTKPAVNALRDGSGNQVATHAASTVTNGA
jgi:hypothetical protein